jgi:membrane protein implicated in regulation of membrane protease activity
MRTLAIILGVIALLFGLTVGGCAFVFLADSFMTGIEGPGADIAIMATGFLLLASAFVALAIWLLRPTKSRRSSRDSNRVDTDAAAP